ncbi:MAG: hypothetical protein ACI936_004228 [Paraglaciecola sp.]
MKENRKTNGTTQNRVVAVLNEKPPAFVTGTPKMVVLENEVLPALKQRLIVTIYMYRWPALGRIAPLFIANLKVWKTSYPCR